MASQYLGFYVVFGSKHAGRIGFRRLSRIFLQDYLRFHDSISAGSPKEWCYQVLTLGSSGAGWLGRRKATETGWARVPARESVVCAIFVGQWL